MRFLPVLSFMALLLILGALLLARPEAEQGTASTQRLPALGLRAIESGEPWRLETLQGKVIVLNFFASWCTPCAAEMPELVALKQQFPALHIAGVAWNDDPKMLGPWLKKHGNPFDTLWLDAKGEATIDLGIKGIPETILVDGAGTIRYRLTGPLTAPLREKTLAPLIETMLGEATHGP